MICCGQEYKDEPDGECQECGGPTYKGESVDDCYYSSMLCKTCKAKPCDGSC